MGGYIDLDESGFDPDLHLPIRGKWYTVPSPHTWEDTKRLRQRIVESGLPPVEQVDDALTILGAVRDPETGELEPAGVLAEMTADNLPWPIILHAGRTAQLHFGYSPEMAEAHWGLSWLGKVTDLEKLVELFGRKQPSKKQKAKTSKRGDR
ncbi:hypothetical protein [Rhodococcus sp. MEB032]|uniref:DUF7426 family protein n=1 Tax=Rhodococcus sp. MEB032 TaxID=3040322 RepID=UPI00254F0802|nr:hypothetical protein [Rhodococcus sp. MEB032]